jgi:hypothetical protein
VGARFSLRSTNSRVTYERRAEDRVFSYGDLIPRVIYRVDFRLPFFHTRISHQISYAHAELTVFERLRYETQLAASNVWNIKIPALVHTACH